MFSGIDVFASRYAFSFDIEEASTVLIPKIKASSYSIFILFSEFFGEIREILWNFHFILET